MEESGFHQFAGNLDPSAQEFVPRNHHLPFVSNNFYYTYTSLPPYNHPSPPLSQPPFVDGSPLPGYAQPFSSTPAYIDTDHLLVPPVSLPSSRSRTMPSRALLLTMVPADVSESTVRRELEVFGDVRAVQMERVREGIVTVHFYNLRQAQEALTEIQAQHMQQQHRLRRHYETVVAQNSLNLNLLPCPHPPPPMPPPAPGLIAGRAVWAQFTAPVASRLPDGNNQGTLVLFNLDPDVTTSSLEQTFEAFGPVKELRETPMKRHQRFVEFYDIRDAAKALTEMNGKEIHGKQIVIEFSRPGGLGKKHSKFAGSFASSRLNFVNNYSARPIMPPPSPPSQQLPCNMSGYSPPPRPSYNLPPQFSDKRSSYSKGNPKSSGDKRSSIQNSMASLSVNGTCSEKSAYNRPSNSKRNGKKSGGNHDTNSTGTSKQHQQQHEQQQTKGSRPWKGLRQSKEYDPRYLIKEDAIMEANCRDPRTTVMIKNIPNKYSQKLLLNMLDNHCIHCNEQIADGDNQPPLSSYDFVYLPIDFVNKCNVGYGFVNMTSPEATLRLYKAFHRQSWEVFNSRKICEVTYARLQGVEALKEHFKNSKFPCEADEYMPVIFSPPRDGRQLSDPVPIIGRSTIVSPTYRTCSSSSPAVSSKEEESENGEMIDYGDFQELQVDGVKGHVNGGVDDNDDDDDGDEDVNSGGGRSSSNDGDSGGQYYDGDDVDDRSEH